MQDERLTNLEVAAKIVSDLHDQAYPFDTIAAIGRAVTALAEANARRDRPAF